MEHTVLGKVGRYALIMRKTEVNPYVVCCGYCSKTKSWEQGFYHSVLHEAMREYNHLTSDCRDCEHRHSKSHTTWCIKANGGVA